MLGHRLPRAVFCCCYDLCRLSRRVLHPSPSHQGGHDVHPTLRRGTFTLGLDALQLNAPELQDGVGQLLGSGLGLLLHLEDG